MDEQGTRDRELEEATEQMNRALVRAGFLPSIIAGERLGLYFQPPRLILGRLTDGRARRAEEIAAEVARANGYSIEVAEEYSRYRFDAWPDETGEKLCYAVVFVGESEGARW